MARAAVKMSPIGRGLDPGLEDPTLRLRCSAARWGEPDGKVGEQRASRSWRSQYQLIWVPRGSLIGETQWRLVGGFIALVGSKACSVGHRRSLTRLGPPNLDNLLRPGQGIGESWQVSWSWA